MDGFQIAGASVPGMDHIMPGESGWKNNQDSLWWHASPTHLVAVVTDGCSSHSHSEVGATLGARIIVNEAARFLNVPVVQNLGIQETSASAFLEWLTEVPLDRISLIAKSVGGDTGFVMEEQFFFSTIGVIVTPHTTAHFLVWRWCVCGEWCGNYLGSLPRERAALSRLQPGAAQVWREAFVCREPRARYERRAVNPYWYGWRF